MGAAEPSAASRLKPGHLRLAWIVTWLLVIVGTVGDNDAVLIVAGVLLIVLGAIYTVDLQGVSRRAAEQAQNDTIFNWINRPIHWRIGGALMALAGIAWIALALG